MSTYEKISTTILGIAVIAMLVFSYHEIKEPASPEMYGPGHSFDTSIGTNFTIGAYSILVGEKSSGGLEDSCTALEPVVVAALHDINERLQKIADQDTPGNFEVNREAVQLLCNKNAQIILANAAGDQLVLDKVPFARTIPPEGSPADIGTEVRINATVIKKGQPRPGAPTAYGDILIRDAFLNEATTSPL